ncbi:hypothetical protein BDY24DRAFT_432743 [Mrakia frigida]|uniref:Bre2p n=1 Tax=Mrakia frigida TaxID=29902 RepID=UPI003FCC2335
MATPLPENSSSLTAISSGENTPKTSPGPEDPPSIGQGSVPPPSRTLEGVPQVPFEDQVARLPTFLTTPQTEEDGLYLTAEMPMNKAGFSYIPCAPSPIVSPSPNYPFLRPIPSFPRRPSSPSSQVHLSFIDRSPHLRISTDALTCSTPLGFRSGRANIPVRAGAWYCEMVVERGGGEPSGALDGSHVRLGFGRREAKLNSPVGLDGYSYGLRDKTGEKVTLSRPTEYLGKGFGSGDVVGMYISLPEIKTEEEVVAAVVDKGKGREIDPSSSSIPSDPLNNNPLPPLDANGASSSSAPPPPPPAPPLSSPSKSNASLAPLQITRHRIPIRYKNQLYFESIDPPVSKEMEALMEPPAPAAPPPPPPPTTTTNSGPSAPAPRKPTTITNKTLPSVDSMRPAIGANPLRPVPILKGSKIAFFVNGESPGVAFEELMDFRPLREAITKKMRGALAEVINGKIFVAKEGTVDDGIMGYYPFVSCYGGGRVTFNPGPNFRFPPPDDVDAYLADPTGDHPRTSIPLSATKVKEDPSSTEDISLDVPPPPPSPSPTTLEPTSAEAPPSNPNLTWTPISSIYPSFHALQEALDERDEQLFIDSYVPDAPDPIPSALDIAARKRKSKDASSEPGSGESSGGRKGQKGKKGVRVKSRLGLHDGLVDSFSPAPTNSEAGEDSSESGSTPARDLGAGGAVGGDASRLGRGGNGPTDEVGSEDAMGEEEDEDEDEEMVVIGGVGGGGQAGPSSSSSSSKLALSRNGSGASFPPPPPNPNLDLPGYQYQQLQQQQYQQHQYQFQQQQFQQQQQQQRFYASAYPLPPANSNPAHFPPPEPFPAYQPSFVQPFQQQFQPQPQSQFQQQPSFAPVQPQPQRPPPPSSNPTTSRAPNGNLVDGEEHGEDEDGLGSDDAEGEMEESGEDEEGEDGWEGGAIKEHVEETE